MIWRDSILENICETGFTKDIPISITLLIYQILFNIEFWFISVRRTLRFSALNFSIIWYQFFHPSRLSRTTLLLYGLMIFKRFERSLSLEHILDRYVLLPISYFKKRLNIKLLTFRIHFCLKTLCQSACGAPVSSCLVNQTVLATRYLHRKTFKYCRF